MVDADKAQEVFERGAMAIELAIKDLKEQGAELDRRTAKMRDMRDKLRSAIAGL